MIGAGAWGRLSAMDTPADMDPTRADERASPPVALVTGASRGIGAAIARRLAAARLRVVCAARSESAVRGLAEEIEGLPVVLDVTDRAAVDAAVARIADEWGPVDVLVNNAGVSSSAPLARHSDADWDHMLAVNLTGPFRLCRALVPGMVERGWGRVVFVASNAGLTGYPYTTGYCASKHGVVGLMRAMAAELARTGVTVNAVCPGFVETDMARDAMARISATTGRDAEAARAALARLNPQKRLIQPDEVAFVVASLVGHDARGINGQALAIDGGQVMS